MDSARFAENAYFIKTREKGYENKSIREIVHEMYEGADYMTMSAKKDAIVNIGGFVAFRDEADMRKAQMFTIMNEGFLTYGGMAGRDMNALPETCRRTRHLPRRQEDTDSSSQRGVHSPDSRNRALP